MIWCQENKNGKIEYINGIKYVSLTLLKDYLSNINIETIYLIFDLIDR